MRKGRILISHRLLEDVLQFPPEWAIERMGTPPGAGGVSEMVVVGPDFPEVDSEGLPRRVRLVIHEKRREFEVRDADREA